MGNVKCRNCGLSIKHKNAIKETYITKSLTEANRYFCCDECFKEYHIKEDAEGSFYKKVSEILNIDCRGNKYFSKKLKEFESQENLYIYVYKNYDDIRRDFLTTIKKIEEKKEINNSYRIAVLMQQIKNAMSKNIIRNKKDNLIGEEIIEDYIDYESLMPKGRQVEDRKTILD